MEKHDNNDTKDESFNIYYINFSKVYEISMMINNVLLSSIQRENASLSEKMRSRSLSISGSLGSSSQQYLANIKSVIGTNSTDKSITSSKMIESLDVKTTKSILLRQIIEKCKLFSSFLSIAEGDLIKMDNIKLKILNEENLRQILMLRKDALKGFRVEGMEVNNLISSILQDYSYILYGEIEGDGEISKIMIKIPLEIQNEFESNYSVNDLLIGHVSVIGVYKGIVNETFITSNTFNYFAEHGNQQEIPEKKVIPSSKPKKLLRRIPLITTKEKTYQFLDVISIVQDVSFFQKPTEILKVSWFKKVINKIWR